MNFTNTLNDVVFLLHLSIFCLVILQLCGILHSFIVNSKAGQSNMARYMEFIKELILLLLLAILIFCKKFSLNNFPFSLDEDKYSRASVFIMYLPHRVHHGVGIVM